MNNEELVAKYQAGDELAFEELLEKNMGLITQLVKQACPMDYRNYRLENDDLFQVGLYYMTLATKRYNPNKGIRWSTYMGSYIVNGVRTYVMDNRHGIRVPRTVIIWSYEYFRLVKKGYTSEEISEKMGIPLKEIELLALRTHAGAYISTSEVIGGDTVALYIEDLLQYDSDDYEFIDFINSLSTKSLTDNERKVFEIYKKNKMQPMYNQHEISEMTGLSQPAVSRIQKKMLRKLLNMAY